MSDDLLQRLKADLRALGLAERGGVYERRGLAIARLSQADGAVRLGVVQRPSRNSPEWNDSPVADSAAARDLIAGLKKRLAAWNDRDG